MRVSSFEEAARVQANSVLNSRPKREAAAANGQEDALVASVNRVRHRVVLKNNDRKPRADKPAAKAQRAPREEPRHTPAFDINALERRSVSEG